MFTYKLIFSNILETLDFLSDINECSNSWINGSGKYSMGWKEEIGDLDSDGFFSFFPERIIEYNLSEKLKDDLLALISEMNSFLDLIDSNLSNREFLKNKDWLKLIEDIKSIIVHMKLEKENVPDQNPLKYSYKKAFNNLLRHLELLASPQSCKYSWFHRKEPFSLGLDFEISVLKQNPFFSEVENVYINELPLSDNFKTAFLKESAELYKFFMNYRYKISDSDLLVLPEWLDITRRLKLLVMQMKIEMTNIPEDQYFDFSLS